MPERDRDYELITLVVLTVIAVVGTFVWLIGRVT